MVTAEEEVGSSQNAPLCLLRLRLFPASRGVLCIQRSHMFLFRVIPSCPSCVFQTIDVIDFSTACLSHVPRGNIARAVQHHETSAPRSRKSQDQERVRKKGEQHRGPSQSGTVQATQRKSFDRIKSERRGHAGNSEGGTSTSSVSRSRSRSIQGVVDQASASSFAEARRLSCQGQMSKNRCRYGEIDYS